MRFLVDTNVFLRYRGALDVISSEGEDIVLSYDVIRELDGNKGLDGNAGRNARQTLRYIRRLVEGEEPGADISLPGGGKLFLELPEDISRIRERAFADPSLLEKLADSKDAETILITEDNALAILAYAGGHRVKSLEEAAVAEPNAHRILGLESGIVIPQDYKTQLWKGQKVYIPEGEIKVSGDGELTHNQYFILEEFGGILVQYTFEGGRHALKTPRIKEKEFIQGIRPESRDQRALMDACLGNAPFIAAAGRAGTGKTLAALACGLYKLTSKDSRIERLRIIRPFDDEFGYLPGGMEDKIAPAMAPIVEAGKFLFSRKRKMGGRHVETNEWDRLIKNGQISLEIERFHEGETFRDEFVIADEIQNLSPEMVKILTTRIGNGSQMVLSGDPFQTKSSTGLTEENNGLTYFVQKMRGQDVMVPVVLTERSIRSKAADIASKLL